MRQFPIRLILVIFLVVLVLTGGLIFKYFRVSKKNNPKTQAPPVSPSVEESLKAQAKTQWNPDTAPVSATIMGIDSEAKTMALLFSWPLSLPFQNKTRVVGVNCSPKYFRYYGNYDINNPQIPGEYTTGGYIFEQARVGDLLRLFCEDAKCKFVGGAMLQTALGSFLMFR